MIDGGVRKRTKARVEESEIKAFFTQDDYQTNYSEC